MKATNPKMHSTASFGAAVPLGLVSRLDGAVMVPRVGEDMFRVVALHAQLGFLAKFKSFLH